MKKTEYDSIIEYAKDPYQGWIRYKEPALCAELPKEEIAEGFHQGQNRLNRINYLELIQRHYVLIVSENGYVDFRDYKEIYYFLQEKMPDILYADEDIQEGTKRVDPFFKPDFSPDLLEESFYLGSFLLVKKEICPKEFDYRTIADLALSVFYEKGADAIAHLPRVVYHGYGKRDLGYKAPENGTFSPAYREDSFEEKITAVILSKDNPKMLFECVDSVQRNSNCAVDILVVDNGSGAENKAIIEEGLAKRGAGYLYHPQEFVYSALCNLGAKNIDGGYILFLNDDVVVPDDAKCFPGCLLKRAKRSHAGAVGIRLRYPDNTIQHAGIVHLNAGPSHILATMPDDAVYDFGRNRVSYNCLAVTGACLMVAKEKFDEVGGFDESLHVAYTDVDLCLDLFEKGYYSVMVNDCFLYHHESVSRGRESLDEKKAQRLLSERTTFYKKHPWTKEYDPFYNPNLTKSRIDGTADYDSPWEAGAWSKNAQDMVLSENGSTKCSSEKRLLMSIDRVSHIASSFENEENYREIEGWVILRGQDNAKCEPFLMIETAEGKTIPLKVRRKLRAELPEVFAKEKKVALSGFVVRIPDSVWADLAPFRVGAGVCRKGIFGAQIQEYRMSDAPL